MIGLPDVVTVPFLPGVFVGTEHRVLGPGTGVPGTGSRYWVPGPGVTEASSEYTGRSTDNLGSSQIPVLTGQIPGKGSGGGGHWVARLLDVGFRPGVPCERCLETWVLPRMGSPPDDDRDKADATSSSRLSADDPVWSACDTAHSRPGLRP